MTLILLILVLVLLFGTGPWYPYSQSWGYTPFGTVLVILLLVLLVLFLTGNMAFGPRVVVR